MLQALRRVRSEPAKAVPLLKLSSMRRQVLLFQQRPRLQSSLLPEMTPLLLQMSFKPQLKERLELLLLPQLKLALI